MDKGHCPRMCCLAIFSLLWLGGCTTPIISVIPNDLKQEVVPALAFHEVIENPEAFIGETVMWGGTILKTTVRHDGTLLEIIQKPLNQVDQPLATDASLGRFLVERTNAFLDPAIFEKGRAVTVIGTITKEQVQPLDEIDYRYPYIVASHIHLWPESMGPGGYPYWGFPYSFWYGGGYGYRGGYGYGNPYGFYPYGGYYGRYRSYGYHY